MSKLSVLLKNAILSSVVFISFAVTAQEVEEVLPEAVYETPQGKKALHYANMVGLLVEAVKELKAEVEELKTKIG